MTFEEWWPTRWKFGFGARWFEPIAKKFAQSAYEAAAEVCDAVAAECSEESANSETTGMATCWRDTQDGAERCAMRLRGQQVGATLGGMRPNV